MKREATKPSKRQELSPICLAFDTQSGVSSPNPRNMNKAMQGKSSARRVLFLSFRSSAKGHRANCRGSRRPEAEVWRRRHKMLIRWSAATTLRSRFSDTSRRPLGSGVLAVIDASAQLCRTVAQARAFRVLHIGLRFGARIRVQGGYIPKTQANR